VVQLTFAKKHLESRHYFLQAITGYEFGVMKDGSIYYVDKKNSSATEYVIDQSDIAGFSEPKI
jgi:hypothetical protein